MRVSNKLVVVLSAGFLSACNGGGANSSSGGASAEALTVDETKGATIAGTPGLTNNIITTPTSLNDPVAPVGGNDCFALVPQSNGSNFSTTTSGNYYYSNGLITFGLKNICSTPAIINNLTVNLAGSYNPVQTLNSTSQSGNSSVPLTLGLAMTSSNVGVTLSSPVCNDQYCLSKQVASNVTYQITIKTQLSNVNVQQFATTDASLSYTPAPAPVGGNECFNIVAQPSGNSVDSTIVSNSQYFSQAKMVFSVKNTCSKPAMLSNYKLNLIGASINNQPLTSVNWVDQNANGNNNLSYTFSNSGNNLVMTLNGQSGFQVLPNTGAYTFTLNKQLNAAITQWGVSKITTSNSAAQTAKLLAVGTYGLIGAGVGDAWGTLRYPMVNYTSVAYGAGTYVTVGDVGTVLVSSDATNWSTVKTPTSQALKDVSYANGNFIAVGAAGIVLTSPTGESWSASLTLPVAYPLNSVDGDGTNYVGVGNNGVIYLINPQGVGSGRITSPTTQALNSIAWANGVYVAVGNNGTIINSSNGRNWRLVSVPYTNSLKNVHFLNGKFYVVGSNGLVLLSSDGTNWTSSSIANSVFNYSDIAMTANNSLLSTSFNGAYSYIGTSTTLPTWVYYQGLTTSYLFNSAVCGNNACSVVGNSGMNLSSTDNGRTWKLLRQTETPSSMAKIASGGGKFVAVGNSGAILVSSDSGETWLRAASPIAASLRDVKYINGKFYAVGASGTIIVSSDGLVWTTVASGTSVMLNSIAYNPATATYIIVGDSGVVLSSNSGANWVMVNSATTSNITYIAYASGQQKLVAVGDAGLVLTIGNNNLVTKVTTGSTANLRGISIAYITNASGNYVQPSIAAGSNGSILLSTQAGTWVAVSGCNIPTTISLSATAISGNAMYVGGDAGTLAKITLDQNNAPVCTNLNSSIGGGTSIWGLTAL